MNTAEQLGYPIPPGIIKLLQEHDRREASLAHSLTLAIRHMTDKNYEAAQNELVDALFMLEGRK